MRVHRWCFVHKRPRVWKLPGPDVSHWARDQGRNGEQRFCFLPGLTSVDRRGKVNFTLPFVTNVAVSVSASQIFRSWVAVFRPRPPVASLFRSLYNMLGLAPRVDVLFWGRRGFQVGFSSGVRQGALGVVIEEVLWSIRGYHRAVWGFPLTSVWPDHTQWQHPTDQTFYRTQPFTEFWEVSMGHLRRVWHADGGGGGALAPPDALSRPLGLAYVLLVETNPFSELVVIFSDYALRISLGTFSILLLQQMYSC